MSALPVDVVVPCWGTYVQYLERCLSSIPPVTSVRVLGDASAVAAAARLGFAATEIEVLDPGHARERGRQLGTAPYFCVLDVDDRLRPDALRTMFAALERHPSAVAVTGRLGGSTPGHTWPPRVWAGVALSGVGAPVLLARNCFATVGACLIRRSRVPESVALFPELLDEDWHAAVALRSLGKVVRINRVLVDYDVRTGSRSRSSRELAAETAAHDALIETARACGAKPFFVWRAVEPAARCYRNSRERRLTRRMRREPRRGAGG